MLDQVSRLHVFVASPGDTQEERDRLEAVVAELNRGIAAEKGLVLELVRWETHVRPGIGSDAQAVINAQLPDPDVVVAIFWKRLGTPPPRAGSGTAEEIEAAIRRWREHDDVELLVYFNQQPWTPRRGDLDQAERLLAFREQLQNLGVLVCEYDGAADFEAKVREHLGAAVRARTATFRAVPTSAALAPAVPEPSFGSPSQFKAEIDVRNAAEVQRVTSDVRAALREHGFRIATADRTATVLLELLANVRDHAASPAALLEVSVRRGSLVSAELTVSHAGAAFDARAAATAGWRAYERGAREHGLVKAQRLASGLHVLADHPRDGHIAVRCTVFDLDSIGSGIFSELERVTPVSIEFDMPPRCFLGTEAYDTRALEDVLEFALSEPAPRLLELCFGGLTVAPGGWLGIELAGNVIASETYRPPFRPAPMSPVTLPPRSEHALHAGFEVCFRKAFESGCVVFHAFETGFTPRAMTEDWAARWDAPCFTDPEALRVYLREHCAG